MAANSGALVVPSHCFGLKPDVKDNISFLDEQNVAFPVGSTVVLYNMTQKSQRFIVASEGAGSYSAMAVSPNRRYVAVAERSAKPSIAIYDLHTLKKRKVLSYNEGQVTEFVSMCFSPDSKYLVTLGGGPECTLLYWTWEKTRGPMAATRVATQADQEASSVTFNPQDNTQLCVTGRGVLKLYRYLDGHLKQLAFQKMDPQNFLCQAWLSDDRLAVGTETGKVLLFDAGEFKAELPVASAATTTEGAPTRVECIVALPSGFSCATNEGIVYTYEAGEDKELYKHSRRDPVPNDCSGRQTVLNLAVSPSSDTLLCSTSLNQLYVLNLNSDQADIPKDDEEEGLHKLSNAFHHGPITAVDVCARKPLVATCSSDRSVRIWNYIDNSLEIVKYFSEEAQSLSLHPSGFYVLVGFADKLRLMNILIDDLQPFKEFSVRGCDDCRFSNGGHLFAAVVGNSVQIYTTYTFNNIGVLKGHNGKVRSVCWSADDLTMVTCGADGAVYEWDMQTFKRTSESVLKSCSYSCAAFSPDAKTVYAVGNDKTLKEISDNQIVKDIPSHAKAAGEAVLTQVHASASGRMLLAGTAYGSVRSLKFPLTVPWEGTVHPAHCGPITKMRISGDDNFLFTVGADGCLFIFNLTDKDGRSVKREKETVFASEILISRSDLEEKNHVMGELKTRVEELKMANEYQLRLKDMNYNEKMKELTDKFIQEMEALKLQNQMLKSEKDKEEARHDEEVGEVMDRHQRELQERENDHNQKLLREYEKFQDLQRRSQEMQEKYEAQIQDMEASKQQALEELAEYWENKLLEKTGLLEASQDEKRDQGTEYRETRRQIEIDADREILAIKNRYERQLKEERENSLRLKGDNGILRKKFRSLVTEIEDQKKRKEEMDAEQGKLHNHIKTLDKEIQSGKKEIEERNETIQDKEKRIYDLKKKNQELEKFKFVLDYKIKELKKQIEPRENDIKEMKVQIAQMDQELERAHKTNTSLNLQIDDFKLRLHSTEDELSKQRTSATKQKNVITRMRADLQETVGLIQQPKQLADRVRSVHKRHCTEGKEYTTPVEDDIQNEYNRQREFLERTVASLRKKLNTAQEMHKTDTVRVMQENVALIREINDLRKELKLARQSEHHLEATIKSTRKISEMRGKTLPAATLDVTSMGTMRSLSATQETGQIEKIIDMQKQEIRRLRQALQTMEKQARDRPPSTGRLPELSELSSRA